MAKKALEGTITAFRTARRHQEFDVTIVEVKGAGDRTALVGAKAEWTRPADGFRMVGRVEAPHGNGAAVRVRWRKGFPPQGIGSPVAIHPK